MTYPVALAHQRRANKPGDHRIAWNSETRRDADVEIFLPSPFEQNEDGRGPGVFLRASDQ
jgi:hypothetical protein